MKSFESNTLGVYQERLVQALVHSDDLIEARWTRRFDS